MIWWMDSKMTAQQAVEDAEIGGREPFCIKGKTEKGYSQYFLVTGQFLLIV